MTSPCALGFLRARWLRSRNEHPKRIMRKLFCLLLPTLRSQVASILLFPNACENQGRNTYSTSQQESFAVSDEGWESLMQLSWKNTIWQGHQLIRGVRKWRGWWSVVLVNSSLLRELSNIYILYQNSCIKDEKSGYSSSVWASGGKQMNNKVCVLNSVL